MWHGIYIVLKKNSKITMVHFQKHGIAIAMFKNLANSIFIPALFIMVLFPSNITRKENKQQQFSCFDSASENINQIKRVNADHMSLSAVLNAIRKTEQLQILMRSRLNSHRQLQISSALDYF